jgi:hypothetical protein
LFFSFSFPLLFPNGQKVLVEQTAWSSIRSCVASVSKGLILDLGPTPNAAFGTSMGQSRSVAPHVVLVRNFAKGVKNDEYRVRKKKKKRRKPEVRFSFPRFSHQNV